MILMAFDESPFTPFLFEQALTLAEQENAVCQVFHCIDLSHLSQYTPITFLSAGEEKNQKLLQLYQHK